MRPVFNTTVTNMPGPRQALYMAGAELIAMFGAGMITEGMGLIHPVMSYRSDITISFTSCREMLPDPAFYAESLRASFDELFARTAARAGGRRARAATGTRPPGSRRRGSTAAKTPVAASA
jgi:hypothetical protein